MVNVCGRLLSILGAVVRLLGACCHEVLCISGCELESAVSPEVRLCGSASVLSPDEVSPPGTSCLNRLSNPLEAVEVISRPLGIGAPVI